MKIIKYIAIGICVLFTTYDLGSKFLIWSGILEWMNQPAVCPKGGVVLSLLLISAWTFAMGWDIARSKYTKKSLDVEGKGY